MAATALTDRPLTRRTPAQPATRPSRWSSTALWAAAAAITAIWTTGGLIRQKTMRTGIDLGLYTQAVERYSHGQWPWSFLKARGGFNLLGDHFTPIVAVLGPVYRIWPHTEVLIIAQAVLIGLTVVLLGRTASAVLGPGAAAVLVAAAFGLSWGVAGMALFDFHEVALALPMLAISLDRAISGRWRDAVLWSLPLMLVKEDSAFLIAGLAIACWAAGHRRLAAATMAYAVSAFAVVVGVIIPWFSYSGTYTYWAATGAHHGATGAIADMASNLWHATASGQAPLTVFLMLACVAFLPLRSPLVWVAAPPLLVRFTSAQSSYWGPHAHYNATLMVVVFMAALDGWRRRRSTGARTMRPKVLASCFLVLALIIGGTTPMRTLVEPSTYSCDRCSAAEQMLARIPNGAVVTADTFLVDQLVDRTQVHLLAQNLVDSTGHTYQAEWVALDIHDADSFPVQQWAYWYGSGTAQAAGYIPVWASTSGYILMHYNPAAANAFLHMYGAVACAASASEASLCSTPPGDDTYRTRTAWCATVDPPHSLYPCPPNAYRQPYRGG